MNIQQLFSQLGGRGGMPGAAPSDEPLPDTSEKVLISGLALLKMLKHGRAGIPMEVMGLMLGQFVDDYTITCVDVFAMPQHGTGVSVEAVDPVFQTKMLDMLKQTGRSEIVVGWYHSHPGFGCWLSGVDMGTQMSFERLHPRSVAVVIDPVQSVKGKVVIDAFRLISPKGGGGMMMMMMGGDPNAESRQTTSHVGMLKKSTIQARIHGLDRMYYSLVIDWCRSDAEEKMLLNLHRSAWSESLLIQPPVCRDFDKGNQRNQTELDGLVSLSGQYPAFINHENSFKTIQEADVARDRKSVV